ncbi:Arc family DNA-binding protein [Neorhizobium lilium]|uniref:Arc family DNA-binding protein n=1 Tax=Neorhizobium lilium TaxID=2503024 RepID=A0A444LA55_9HYPH|nr:Arc family DNA-binding protein [Neorhizobium lilium]RWX74453.1 Arc family DNA-binding protein [Neorhizobium lilium]
MGREDPQLKLRLTEDMKGRITEAAKANGRSVNAEIVARLEAYEAGGDVGQDWKRRFAEEQDAYRRMERLYDGTFDVAMNYRTILATVRGQLLQYVGLVKSLASIITNLEGPPPPDAIDLATRLEAAASETKERLSQETPLDQAKSELKKLEALISKSDDLTKRD